jgi:monofunctional glycosyltransferase
MAEPGAKRRGWFGRLFRTLVLIVVLVLFVGPVIAVAVYRFVPPPATPLMLINAAKGRGIDYRWRSLDDIDQSLARAAIAAEDARFCLHRGFEIEAMRKALERNGKGGKIRGGSTISQQVAKNVFLWPDRTYVRKGLEAWFTVLIETIWGKRRIMEVYLNVAEWGPGTYGAEAAADRYFRVSAADLTATQSSRLAAILPSPLKWKAAKPGPYVRKRSRRIGGAAAQVRRDGLAGCLA